MNNNHPKLVALQKFIFFIVLMFLSETSFTQIKVGSKAPKINISNWIQTKSKNEILENKFMVIDFWATWCAPCLASMSHMNTLVEKNKAKKNLIFLAMSDERKEKIFPILSRVKFEASVVTDTSGQTQKNFQINSIPKCIIIDDNDFIRWVGNPEQLTNEIIQDILARKDLIFINSEEVILDDNKEYYDSLQLEYRSIFDDNNVKEYFSCKLIEQKSYGSMYSSASTNSLRKVEIGVKLSEVISEQMSIASSQISLPEDVDNLYISYCYKSETKVKGENILSSVLTAAGLTCVKNDSFQKAFLMKVVDTNLLHTYFLKNQQERISHFSYSDDGKFIAMSNSSMLNIVSTIQKRFKCPILIEDSSIFSRPLDMMLQTDDFQTLEKSMRSYGIDIIEIKQSLPFVIITHHPKYKLE